jgi:hypothetical protein
MRARAIDGAWYGLYMARVVEHVTFSDGSGIGGVRVLCPVLYGDAKSPTCFPLGGAGGGGFFNPNGVAVKRGLFAVPPIGSDVAIGLYGGDPNLPLCFPGWWHNRGTIDNPDLDTPSSPKQTVPQGSPLAVVWETDKWRILIEDGASPKLRFEKKGNEDTAVEIDGTTEVVEIQSKPSGGQTAKVTIDGATGTVTVDADTEIKLGASAMEKLVKGSTFLTFFNAHTHGGVTVGAGATTGPVAPMLDATHLSQLAKTE